MAFILTDATFDPDLVTDQAAQDKRIKDGAHG
jgi:hypothetical protein